MSLEASFNEIEGPPTRCKTCLWYAQLEPEDKVFFDEKAEEALAGGNTMRLFEACRRNGLDAVSTSFRDHLANNHTARFKVVRSKLIGVVNTVTYDSLAAISSIGANNAL